MPNWVQNNISLYGEKENIKRVLELVKSDESAFDFNKIIPMPKELNIASSSTNDAAIVCYMSNKLTIPFDKLNKEFLNKYVSNMFSADYTRDVYCRLLDRKEEHDELYELGKVCCENILKYGHVDWYDWRVYNWGTKWNACEEYVGDDYISFQTAWSVPDGILREFANICKQYDVSFDGYYADEDRGNNTGYFNSENGIMEYTNGSQEALETYIECWGESDCIGKDEDGNLITYDCDDCPNSCW